jgi:hypothetical protein
MVDLPAALEAAPDARCMHDNRAEAADQRSSGSAEEGWQAV